jgi:hypothetical protein
VENFLVVQYVQLRIAPASKETRTNTESSPQSTVQAAQQHGRVAKRTPVIAREKTHGKIAHRADKRETCTPGKQARRRMRRNFFENLC